jgi:cell division protein ZapE
MREQSTVDLHDSYARELHERGWSGDDAQRAAVARLEQLRRELLAAEAAAGALARWRRLLGWPHGTQGVRGVYLWGGVGRGKTWLMDLFYDGLAATPRRRVHFHHLMRDLHQGLATLRHQQDPLATLARRMVRRARVWCIDELHVADIADAMILGGLFDALVRAGVTLVITANEPPAGLYRDGLQRARFLPAIALLERHLELLQVDAGVDYRLRQLRQAPIYLPTGEATTAPRLAALFTQLAGAHAPATRQVVLDGRPVVAERRAGGVIWFSFATLCAGARNATDYARLAEDFHTVFLTGIPVLDGQQEDAARRFIALVDEFYDQGVKLVVSAAAGPASLYGGQRLEFEFRRTTSRLIEMQSEEYLGREHCRPARP